MPTEVLSQLRVLRETIAEGLRQDVRYLTLASLDKSIAEISNMPGATDPAPTEVLGQLRVLRETVADAQRKDARYLTLISLDKSIAEIANVLGTTDHAPASPLSFEAPPGATPSAAPPAASAPKNATKSLAQPVAETAAVLASAGVAAEVVRAQNQAAGTGSSEVGAMDVDGGEADGDDDPEADPAAGNPPEPGSDAEAKARAAGIIPEGKASGYVPMQARAGAPQYQPAISVKFGKLPNKVDLRPLMTPIEDQGQTSSCVANAVAGAYEYWIKKASKQDQNISRLFVYYNARWRDGSQDTDDGSVIQLAMEGLKNFGACNEHVWPFDTHLVTKKPGAEAYQDAAPFKVQDMAQVPLKLDAWKQALAEGKPIVFGCLLFDSFDECSKNGGVVPMPAPEDVARKTHSGHSMCAVGYSESEKVFIVRNSWGAEWGDKGYCYMPYAYLMNSKLNDGDCWVFVPKVPSQPPREVWSDDTSPVTNDGRGVDFPIETYSVAQYEALAVDLFEGIRKPFNTFVREDFSEYVSFASQSLWSRMESVDVRGYLATAAAMAAVSSAMAGDFWSSETSESSSESVSAVSDEAADEDQDADETQDEDEASDVEQDEDETSDEEQDEDEASDAEQDADESSDEDQDEDDASDEDSDDEDGEESGDEDGEASDEDGDESGEDSNEDDDDSEEDEGGEEGGDDEGDDGGGEEGGDDGDD